MMIYPRLSDLIEKAGSRYSLVIATAKRARELSAGESPLVSCDSSKPVSIAINEINSGVVEIIDRKDKVVQQLETEGVEEALEEPVIEEE